MWVYLVILDVLSTFLFVVFSSMSGFESQNIFKYQEISNVLRVIYIYNFRQLCSVSFL